MKAEEGSQATVLVGGYSEKVTQGSSCGMTESGLIFMFHD